MPVYIAVQSASTRQDHANYPIARAQAVIPRSPVYINIPGRICLHEPFIEYEQVTTWVARFFFQQIGGKLSYTIDRRLHWMAQWAGAQVAVTTVWLSFKS